MIFPQFLEFILEHYVNLFLWMISLVFLFYFIYNKLLIGRSFDPFHFVISFTFGTSYGIVCSMYQYGYISDNKFFVVLVYALCFHIPFYILSIKPIKTNIKVSILFDSFFLKMNERIYINLILFVFLLGSLVVVFKSGFLIFTDTNRFESAKGIGGFVRFSFVLSLLLVCYYTAVIYKGKILKKNWRTFSKRNVIKTVLILFVVIVSSLINGAKSAMLWYIYAIIMTIFSLNPNFRLPKFYTLSIIFVSLLFALVVLNFNIKSNNQETPLFGVDNNPLVDRFIARILANGDQYYHSLPNDVIDNIGKDNLWVRLYSNVVSNSFASKIEGYDVSNFNVGRSILLYLNPNVPNAGGPVSHFDLFFYSYCGCFGYLLTILIAIYLAWLLKKMKKNETMNTIHISFYVVLWIQSIQLLVEPSVVFAYLVDLIVVFVILKMMTVLISNLFKIKIK